MGRAEVIVLDTHALIWWVNDDENLSHAARKAINDTLELEGQVLVSAITAWEIATLVERGRLSLSMSIDDWLLAVSTTLRWFRLVRRWRFSRRACRANFTKMRRVERS